MPHVPVERIPPLEKAVVRSHSFARLASASVSLFALQRETVGPVRRRIIILRLRSRARTHPERPPVREGRAALNLKSELGPDEQISCGVASGSGQRSR